MRFVILLSVILLAGCSGSDLGKEVRELKADAFGTEQKLVLAYDQIVELKNELTDVKLELIEHRRKFSNVIMFPLEEKIVVPLRRNSEAEKAARKLVGLVDPPQPKAFGGDTGPDGSAESQDHSR